jgi:hypothetical protein
MEEKDMPISWGQLRPQLMENSRMQELFLKLKKREHINIEEVWFLNLFLQEEANKRAEAFASESRKASDSYVNETLKVSNALKNATRWMAIATIVLALTAVAQIILRLCNF